VQVTQPPADFAKPSEETPGAFYCSIWVMSQYHSMPNDTFGYGLSVPCHLPKRAIYDTEFKA
jgi:hypothetical protein